VHRPVLPDDERARTQVTQHFAPFERPGQGLVEEIWQDYHTKLATWRERIDGWRDLSARWREEVRPQLSDWTCAPQKLAIAAKSAGLARSLAELPADAQGAWARDAMACAHLVRRRFTLGDLLGALGWLTEANIAQWLKPLDVTG
jgi:hypothetical protein